MKSDNENNYYDILDLQKDATFDDIKKAYRKMAFKYHPDRNLDSKDDNRFKLISEAYHVLSDERKRQIYDLGGNTSTNYNFIDPFEIFNKSFNDNVNLFTGNNDCDDILRNFSNINFTDINKIFDTFSKSSPISQNNGAYDFNTLFNFGMSNNSININTTSTNNNLIYNLNVSIRDLYNEVEKKVKIERTIKCKEGLFYIYKNKIKTYKIIFYNRNIKFKNKGNETRSGKGDLILNIFPKEYNGYRCIKENDLVKEFEIQINDIYNDYILKLNHLDNKTYYIQHTKKSFLERGTLMFKIPSLGLPYKTKEGTKRGTLFIKYNLILPLNIQDIIPVNNNNTKNSTSLQENWLVAYSVELNEIL